MYYYLLTGCLAVFSGAALFIKLNKKIRLMPLAEKITAIVFAAVFFVRYYFYLEYAIDNVTGLDNGVLPPAMTVFSMISVWLEYAAFNLLVLKPFFKVGWLSAAVKVFCLPVYVLNIIFLLPDLTLLMGPEVTEKFTLSSVAYVVEIVFGLSLSIAEWIDRPLFGKCDTKGLWVFAVIGIVYAMPSYALHVLFGNADPLIVVDSFTAVHRIFLYASFIIPFAIYFSFRGKDEDYRRFAMTYLAVSAMITFCTRYKYDTFLDPTSWPLHLCNTAMFVVPICLIFNLKKLFYFTYFINVMGAFFAMAMPNYTGANLFSWSLVNFWVNHYNAFYMPILLVALKIFDRPKIKQFYYSMAFFLVYFIAILFINAWFSNYGTVDFFFLNSTFIPEKFGNWAENMFKITAGFTIGGLKFEFHPLYQAAFFLTYVGIAFGIWFIYAQFFVLADSHYEMHLRRMKIRQDEIALASAIGGYKTEPMNKEAGIKLELKHFSKKYASSKIYAVKDANLCVSGGEIFGFLGPNGAGKSTIIKSIVGIQPISEGAIEVCGYDCAKQPRQAKGLIGFVPDHYALYEKLTGREYINYIADIYDVSEKDRTERIDEMVRLFELEGSFDSSMKTYSHGMKQKITIMAALVHNPKLWILDEPLTGLDPNSIYQVKECMRRHAANGNIVFFSSHIIDVVERICDRIAIIKKGNIVCESTLEDIEKQCPLEEFYLKTINDAEFAQKVLAEEKNGAAPRKSEGKA